MGLIHVVSLAVRIHAVPVGANILNSESAGFALGLIASDKYRLFVEQDCFGLMSVYVAHFLPFSSASSCRGLPKAQPPMRRGEPLPRWVYVQP